MRRIGQKIDTEQAAAEEVKRVVGGKRMNSGGIRMLRKEKVQEIKRLLDQGQMSQRAIARKLDVARGTVNAIALGRRGLHGREIGGESVEELPKGRCEKCGFVGYVPCVVCEARDYQCRHPDSLRKAA